MNKNKVEKGFWTNSGIKPTTKCVSCGETARNILKNGDRYHIEEGSYSEKLGGWLCFPCRESAQSYPHGTVVHYQPKLSQVDKYTIYDHEDLCGSKQVESGDDLENLDIEDLDIDDNSPIQFKYIHTDAWRGYYEPVGEGWKVLHSDCILSYSEDAEELKKFDTDIKKVLWELGYEFAVAYGTTSNLFSCGYDVLIKTEQEQDILKQCALYSELFALNAKYRNSDRFRRTALTGSGEKTPQATLLLEAERRLRNGEDFETIKEDILEKAKQAA